MGDKEIEREIVVVVNGLWMPAAGVALFQRRLRRCGFDVRLFSYRTVAHNLQQNAESLHRYLSRLAAERIHLVGYSLGGLVIRALFAYHPEQRPGRIVTIATPHTGSHAAQALVRHTWGRRIAGRGVGDLVAGQPHRWAPPSREFGVVAGTVGVGLGMLFGGLPAPHDGTVAVAETRLPGATDHVSVTTSHFGMLLSAAVAANVCRFLKTGRFHP